MSRGSICQWAFWQSSHFEAWMGTVLFFKTKTKCVQLLHCFKIQVLHLYISFVIKLVKYSSCCSTYSQSWKPPFNRTATYLLGWIIFIICIKVKPGSPTVCLLPLSKTIFTARNIFILPGLLQIIFCFAISVCVCKTAKIINDNTYLLHKDVVKIN